jgi:hypothetical protein
LDNELNEELLLDISHVDRLIGESKPLFDSCELKTPDYTEMAACAMTLQSFYYGIEKILIFIFQNYDEPLPNGGKWHKELLSNAFAPDKNRKPVFSNISQIELREYLKFRHFIRNAYIFQLEWDKMKNLTTNLHAIWETTKGDLLTFMKASP